MGPREETQAGAGAGAGERAGFVPEDRPGKSPAPKAPSFQTQILTAGPQACVHRGPIPNNPWGKGGRWLGGREWWGLVLPG